MPGKCKAIKSRAPAAPNLDWLGAAHMFKAYYSNDGFCGRPEMKNGLYQYSYQIVDDDFAEDWFGPSPQRLNHTTVRCGAIIECYESKRLNVPFNLTLYHRWMDQTFDWYKLEDEIRYNIEQTPMYGEYAPAVVNYLQRINNLKAFW